MCVRFAIVASLIFFTTLPLLAGATKNASNTKKLNVPSLSVDESLAGFDARAKHLLENTAGRKITAKMIADKSRDTYGNRAIANLHLGRFAEAANAKLSFVAEWFDHPHPRGRDHQTECDFASMKLARAWHLFDGTDKLTPATREHIKRFFLTKNFQSIHRSENHELLFRTSRYLMAQAFPVETFKAYGKTGRKLLLEDGNWLTRYIRFRAQRGWGEFDSGCYFMPDWECLVGLYDYAKDKRIKRLSGMMLDLLLADMAVDSLNGMYCGAHGRIYARHALDHAAEGTWPLQYLYFGNVDPKTVANRATCIDALVSGYRPKKIVVDIALDRPKPYENRERKHLHNVKDVLPLKPLPGSIRKYTYYTPDYVMGCVQRQDPYPPGPSAWYARHEQHDWDLTIGTRTRARIFTHHPGKLGNEHGYWTGDMHCLCGHFFQNKTALVALYDIPGKQPYQFIHAYLPRKEFDEVLEENGWIFVREGKVCAALKMLGGHKWTKTGSWKDVEVISLGARNGAVCEVGLIEDFGGFDAFRREIASNNLQFDPKKMQLTYASKRAGRLYIDTKAGRKLNGKDMDLDYGTYDCPYLKSAWKSGVIDIIKGKRRVRLDFSK